MENKIKHVDYIIKTMKERDLLYYITEPNRIGTVYWAINSLKMLESKYFEKIKPQIINFVFSCLRADGGFGATPEYSSNIVSTFNALQILFLCDQPYFDTKTVEYIIKLQRIDGSFTFDQYGDIDTRFDCCGILSLHLLSIMKRYKYLTYSSALQLFNNPIEIDEIFNESTVCNKNISDEEMDKDLLKSPIDPLFLQEIGFDIELTLGYLLDCFNFDGGVGQIKGSESHSAQIFCLISSLRSLGYIESIDKTKTTDFLVYRQLPNGGLNGRVNKKEDVCYSFWAFSSMILLDSVYIDTDKLKEFIMSCEHPEGGFSDRSGNKPDLYHLMFSLASLDLIKNYKGNMKIDPGFAI